MLPTFIASLRGSINFVTVYFVGESMDIDGMVAMLEYRDIDGDNVPVLMCFKHGLEEEKC